MSPQDAMLHLKNSMHVSANGSSPGSAGAGSGGQVGSSPGSGGSNPASSTPSSDPYKDIPYSKGNTTFIQQSPLNDFKYDMHVVTLF